MEIVKRLLSVGDNELCEKISKVCDGDTVVLENKVYDVWQDNCFHSDGFFFSNTAETDLNPNGERFSAIYLKDKKNVTIDGNGATIMLHGVMTPFMGDGCENITIKNLTIDYYRPTMTEFDILENDGNGNALIQIHDDCIYEVKDNFLYFYGEKGKDGKRFFEYPYKSKEMISMYYNNTTEQTKFFNRDEGDLRPSIPTFSSIEDLGKGKVKVTLKNKDIVFPVGCTGQCRTFRRMQTGGFFGESKNIRLENLTIYAMHGFGILFQFCDTVTLFGLKNIRKKGRTLASNADFYHFSGCKGLITIDSCHAETAHDDFINVHGTHLRIVGVDKQNNTVTLKFMNTQTWGFKCYHEGDTVDFIKWNNLTPYASAKVLKFEKLSDFEVKLTLSKIPNNVEIDKDVLEDATYTAKLIVRNNYFGPSMGRGVLCTTRKPILIENNTFYKVGGHPLSVEDDCNFWYESGYCKSIIFRNNTMINSPCGSWDTVPSSMYVNPMVVDKSFRGYVHGKVVIEGNKFVDAEKNQTYLFAFSHTKEVVIKDNVLDVDFDVKLNCVKKFKEKNNKIILKK